MPKTFSTANFPVEIHATPFDAEHDDLPDFKDEIEIYVPTYMGAQKAYDVIDELPNLKYVLLLTAGVDKVLPHIRNGITLCNARGIHDAATAELTLGLAIASRRNIANFVRANNDVWSLRKTESSLGNARVAIVGAGSVGTEIGRLFRAFGSETSLISRSSKVHGTPIQYADDILRSADIVVIVVPLTKETKGLVDHKFLAKLKTGALLINVARGEVVNTTDLVEELASGRINAALDVTDPEPLPKDHALWSFENCIISPHVGGATETFYEKGKKLLEQNLALIAQGEKPLNVITGTY